MLVAPQAADARSLPDDADTVLRPGARPTAPSARFAAPQRRLGFRLGEGTVVPLDVPNLIGRRPRAPRVPAARPPRLVSVPSPGSEISATHIELEQNGESAVVTDLGSANGTRVQLRPGTTVQLRPGESLVLAPGAVVDLGEGVALRIVLLEQEPRA